MDDRAVRRGGPGRNRQVLVRVLDVGDGQRRPIVDIGIGVIENEPDGAPLCASVCSTLPIAPDVSSFAQLVSALATGASLVPNTVIVSGAVAVVVPSVTV